MPEPSIEALLAAAAAAVPRLSFRVGDRPPFRLEPIAEPGRIQAVMYALECPGCSRPWKLAAFRLHVPPAHPDQVTIDGVIRCPHDCGWAAEVVHGVARVLGTAIDHA